MNPIGWCQQTWNPAIGCMNNCEGCYALKMAKRICCAFAAKGDTVSQTWVDYTDALKWEDIDGEHIAAGWSGEVVWRPHLLDKPLRYREPSMIFVCSMADLFCKNSKSEWIQKVIDIAKQCPQHIFQFLTQNPKRYQEFEWPDNCWLGTTVRNQIEADLRLPLLLDAKAKLKFASCEPLDGYIDFQGKMPQWAIVGCRTPYHKEFRQEWARDIIEQCGNANVPVWMKKMPLANGKADDDLIQMPVWARRREWPK